MTRLMARVRGHVQGVGYRWFVLNRAQSLDLAGWVRNRADGSVEFLAEGPRPHLARLLDCARRGPTAARVTEIQEEWSEGESSLEGFEVLF